MQLNSNDKQDTILVSVADNSATLNSNASINLSNQSTVNVQVNHLTQHEVDNRPDDLMFVNNIPENTILLNFQTKQNTNDGIISIDGNSLSAQNIEYNALSVQGNGILQDYQNGDFIQFSDAFTSKLSVGNNFPLFFELELDASNLGATPYQLQLHIPLMITNIYGNDFTIVHDASGSRMIAIRQTEVQIDNTIYKQNLSALTILDTIT